MSSFTSQIAQNSSAEPPSLNNQSTIDSNLSIIKDFDSIRDLLFSPNWTTNRNVQLFFSKYHLHESVHAFRDALISNNFCNINRIVVEHKPQLIISKFHAAYNASLRFDAILFSEIAIPEEIRKQFPSNAQPVNLKAQTRGFSSARTVALFPENFEGNLIISENFPVYYFVNKFVSRFKNITLNVLNSSIVNKSFFSDILQLSSQELMLISSIWVTMHEHFHASGALPFSPFSQHKNSRFSAAFEELRVDLLTIINANKILSFFDSNIGSKVSKFVFAERLFRYPIEASPMGDYDSVSSLMLAQMLRERGALEWRREGFFIEDSIIFESIESILIEMQQKETQIKMMPPESQKNELNKFVKFQIKKETENFLATLFMHEGYSANV